MQPPRRQPWLVVVKRWSQDCIHPSPVAPSPESDCWTTVTGGTSHINGPDRGPQSLIGLPPQNFERQQGLHSSAFNSADQSMLGPISITVHASLEHARLYHKLAHIPTFLSSPLSVYSWIPGCNANQVSSSTHSYFPSCQASPPAGNFKSIFLSSALPNSVTILAASVCHFERNRPHSTFLFDLPLNLQFTAPLILLVLPTLSLFDPKPSLSAFALGYPSASDRNEERDSTTSKDTSEDDSLKGSREEEVFYSARQLLYSIWSLARLRN